MGERFASSLPETACVHFAADKIALEFPFDHLRIILKPDEKPANPTAMRRESTEK